MKYREQVSHEMVELTTKEFSAIQAGLMLLANSATYGQKTGYPEYKKTAGDMLTKIAEQSDTQADL